MTDFLYMMSQAKLAEYFDTRTDLPIRKYVLIANMLRKSSIQEEDRAEEQWLDNCLGALDQQEDELHEDTAMKEPAITVTHYSFTPQDKPSISSSSSVSLPQQQDVNIYQIVLS
ncbi:hypothetical protein BC941DRAFT_422457 [Chlamydoabsidia padenii]|nr:hypothetical protein BC941DRAFT_422457 [Chlamydoabsidia padenii]